MLVPACSIASLPAPHADAANAVSRVLVRTGAAVPGAKALARESGLTVKSVRRIGPRLAVVSVRGAARHAAARLAATRSVVSAAPDRRTAIAGTVAPAKAANRRFGAQWDLWDAKSSARAGGWGIDAPRAWAKTLGSPDVVVAVLDTGVTDHPDLAGASIAGGYDFVSGGDGVDPADGDGWDADPADPGDACADTGEGDSWHGTFVAGEIVAQHRSGGGVAGAAPRVTLEPVRVLGACGGSESDAVAAIEWASGGSVPDVPANPDPADVISMSLGGAEGACSAALQTAIDDAAARGVVVVAAAGNDGRAVASVSPANCRGVISVAATTRSGSLASYSNRGGASLTPTIAAPGGSASQPVLGDGWNGDGDAVVTTSIGTSMAAPLVSAAVGLLLSAQPGLTPDQVRTRLIDTATRFPVDGGCTLTRCGAGIVDAGDLLGAPARFVQSAVATVTGTRAPGRTLTARAGRWRPAPTTVRYRWVRDGVVIPGAVRSTYRLRTKDAGHVVGVRVQVLRAGAVTATATVSAGRVLRSR